MPPAWNHRENLKLTELPTHWQDPLNCGGGMYTLAARYPDAGRPRPRQSPMTARLDSRSAGIDRAQPSPRAPSQRAEHTTIYIESTSTNTSQQRFRPSGTLFPLYTRTLHAQPWDGSAPSRRRCPCDVAPDSAPDCAPDVSVHVASARSCGLGDQAHGLITAGSNARERYECSRTRERLVTTMADTKSANWKIAKSMTSAEPKSATL